VAVKKKKYGLLFSFLCVFGWDFPGKQADEWVCELGGSLWKTQITRSSKIKKTEIDSDLRTD
jgi:hypothetical protein